jgi:hypothetical protein
MVRTIATTALAWPIPEGYSDTFEALNPGSEFLVVGWDNANKLCPDFHNKLSSNAGHRDKFMAASLLSLEYVHTYGGLFVDPRVEPFHYSGSRLDFEFSRPMPGVPFWVWMDRPEHAVAKLWLDEYMSLHQEKELFDGNELAEALSNAIVHDNTGTLFHILGNEFLNS